MHNGCCSGQEQCFRYNHIHKLTSKFLHTHIPRTIIKFLTNYRKGPKSYTPFIETHQRNTDLKPMFLNAAATHHIHIRYTTTTSITTTFYVDGITITSTPRIIKIAKAYIQPYIQQLHTWTKEYNLMTKQLTHYSHQTLQNKIPNYIYRVSLDPT